MVLPTWEMLLCGSGHMKVERWSGPDTVHDHLGVRTHPESHMEPHQTLFSISVMSLCLVSAWASSSHST